MKTLQFVSWLAAFASLVFGVVAAADKTPCLTRACADLQQEQETYGRRQQEEVVIDEASPGVGVPNNDTYSGGATESRLRVHIPYALHNKTGEEHVKADYGYASSKSGSIAAFVYYVEKSLCNRMIFNQSTPEEKGWPEHEGGRKSPYILMAPLDFNCHSVIQVRNAQMDGAAALVFADKGCRCTDQNCTASFGPDCYNEDITLTTDGSSLDVSIPSMMLFKPKATAILEQVKKGQTVLMELTWGIPHVQEDGSKKKIGPVHAELWMMAHDPIADLDTITEFAALSKHFAKDAVVAPRYALVDGARFHCDKQVEDGGPCDHLCTNKGKYCALHTASDISGHLVVRETLRRLCIWRHYGDYRDKATVTTEEEFKKTGSTTAAYWNYLLFHRENCDTKEEFAKDECIKKAYQAAKVDEGKINSCMTETGDLDTADSNAILDAVLAAQKHDGVVSVPSIVVDRKTMGSHSSYGLFWAICDPFFASNEDGVVPDLCDKCWDCTNVLGCVTQGGKCMHDDYSKEHQRKKESTGGAKKKKNHPFLRFLGWMIFLGVVAFGGYHVYQTRFSDDGGYGGGGGGAFYTQLVGGSD